MNQLEYDITEYILAHKDGIKQDTIPNYEQFEPLILLDEVVYYLRDRVGRAFNLDPEMTQLIITDQYVINLLGWEFFK
jgi:hypothetical protein